MKTCIIALVVLTLSAVSCIAQDAPISNKIRSGGMLFSLSRTKEKGRTTLLVETDQGSQVIWSKMQTDFTDGHSILDSWSLLDVCAGGDATAILLGTQSDYDLLWIKVVRTDGVWTTQFEQELLGVVFRQRHPNKIVMDGVDGVIVSDDNGLGTFTRNSAGEVFKNGIHFQKPNPRGTLAKP